MDFVKLIRSIESKLERQRKAVEESEELLKSVQALQAAASRAPK